MSKSISIKSDSSDSVLSILTDTLNMDKQAIVFVNTRRGAESQAEKIAISIKTSDAKLINLSEAILKAVSTPTKQCKRLAVCVKKGVAFHHSGLVSKQRELVEDNFRCGLIKVICATPTLAMGIDMPAFRVIIRDLKRYGGPWGMSDIPVLEYEQQAGRAGRPGKEDYGEAICIAQTKGAKDKIFEKYINGSVEDIFSKLAVEPVLRTHILSLISSELVNDKNSLFEFFDSTFYAHQYEDVGRLHQVLEKVIALLDEWGFISVSNPNNGFVSAESLDAEGYNATMIGKRVSELYLDPLTAHFMITCLQKAVSSKKIVDFSFFHMVASTLEIRPLLRVKMSEYELIQNELLKFEGLLLYDEPSSFDESY
ncbi:MAG: hypothetical protein KKF65_04300 [Nanoarchaeota archaeon]|nr:hypothetical protein [Nanoarchaeota archaeon]